jgi:voltage-dependent calcium channel L type alpha-1D
MISRNEGLKVAVLSLINAIPGIRDVLVIAGLFFLLFAIFGVNYFKGSFFFCDETNISLLDAIDTRQNCLDYGGDWIQKDSNFDNVANGMITLFKMSTTEGWIGTM